MAISKDSSIGYKRREEKNLTEVLTLYGCHKIFGK